MQPLNSEGSIKQLKRLKNLEKGKDKLEMRIGQYYSKLPLNQRMRFNKIIDSLLYKYGLNLRNYPMEVLVLRQIALLTVQIEDTEAFLLDHPDERYKAKDMWILKAQKERREAITLLMTLGKVKNKQKEGEDRLLDLKNALREEQGLEKTTYIEPNPDGHARRHYDDIARTEKREGDKAKL